MVSKASRAGLILPPSRVMKILKKHRGCKRMSADSAVALAAIVERFTRDVVSAASNTLEGKKKTLGPRHLAIALSNDSALRDLAGNAHVCGGGFVSDVTVENLQSPRRPKKQKKRKAKKRPAKKASAKKMIAKKTKGPPRGAGQLTRKAAIAAAAAAAGTGPPTDPFAMTTPLS